MVILLSLSLPAAAEWSVISQVLANAESETSVAYTQNLNGYSMEVYLDSVGAVRSRFTIPNRLLKFADKFCPTYQIDRGRPQNRSINGATCLSNERWVEFVLGYNNSDTIASSTLLAIMNGITITFRFRFASGDYDEEKFSLQGSKRAMLIAFGGNINVTASEKNN